MRISARIPAPSRRRSFLRLFKALALNRRCSLPSLRVRRFHFQRVCSQRVRFRRVRSRRVCSRRVRSRPARCSG